MRIRYNIIFIPLLIIVGFAVWFLGLREEREQAARRLADRALLNRDEIDVIELVRPDQTIRVERVVPGEGWRMTRPYESGCSPIALAGLIDAVFQADTQREFKDVSPEQQDEYGITQPELRIRLASMAGRVLMDLGVGHYNPSRSARYASFADDPATCFLVPVYHLEAFDITPEDIRDRRAVAFQPDELVAIQLSSAVCDIHLEKEDGIWFVTSPGSFAASLARLDVLFHNLNELQAEEFLPADADDPELGFNTVDVVFTYDDGSKKKLTLHGEDYSRGIFATSSWQPSPFITQAYIHDRLALDADVFFHVLLIDFPREQIGRVYVRQPGADNLDIKRTGTGPEDWRILRPPERTYTDPGDFDRFIDALLALQPEESVGPPQRPEDYGLDPVYFLQIEAYRDREADQAVIIIGSLDPSGNRYATQDGLTYFTIHGALMDAFMEATNKLRATADRGG